MVKIGMIGCGLIANIHAERLANLGVELTGCYDKNIDCAQKFERTHHARIYPTLEALLDGRPDAVYICTPPNTHLESVLAVCKRRISFFLEKPLAHTIADGEKIVSAVRDSNTLAHIGFNWRYGGGVKKIKEQLAPEDVRFFAAQWYGWAPPTPEWWRKEEITGGLINEVATHVYDLARYLCGEVRRVHSTHERRIIQTPGATSEDTSVSTFEFENGALGTVSFTSAAHVKRSDYGFTEHLLFWNSQDIRLTIVTPSKTYQLRGNAIVTTNDGTKREEYEKFTDTYVTEHCAFLDAIAQGKPTSEFVEDAYRTLRLVQDVKKCARTRVEHKEETP